MHRPSNIKYLALSVLLILASISFIRTTIEIFQSSKKLDTAKQEISSLETKKDQLEKSIAYKKTDSYVEKVARDDLNLVKPGERVFVVKDENYDKDKPKPELDSEPTLGASTERLSKDLTWHQRKLNLKKWLNLFF